MRVLYFHIHGTTCILPYGQSIFKYSAKSLYPDLFTDGTESLLIPLDKAPTATQNFNLLFQHAQPKDRYYFQWSGDITEAARFAAADYMSSQIKTMTAQEDSVKIIILGHSHGGNIARNVALNIQNNDKFEVHVISICTPLCNTPPTLMPSNVKTWQQFYDNHDVTAYMGSLLMQAQISTSISRRIEDVFENSDQILALPQGWKSHNLNIGLNDPHNNAMRKPAADLICKIVSPYLVWVDETPQPTIVNDLSSVIPQSL